jgi:imidazolonepropionase-like amidohydrolase
MNLPLLRAALCALALCAPPLSAQSTPARPRPYALTRVTLVGSEDVRTILIEDGRITRLLYPSEEVPAAYTRIDAEGLVAAPAFLDAFTSAGCEVPERSTDLDRAASTDANVLVDMRVANRKGIATSFRAADVLTLDDDTTEARRKAGFGALLSVPRGEVLAGSSCVATARPAARRDQIVRGDVFQHAAFTARGSGYPSTLMGFHAQLRQFLLDAQRQRALVARWEAARPGPRPAHDADLAAAWGLLDGETTLVCEAETARDVHRWLALADEFGLQIAIAGGREAWKAAEVLKQRDMTVVLTLDWGEEVEDPNAEKKDAKQGRGVRRGAPREDGADAPDEEPEAREGDEEDGEWDYDEPLAVRLARRARWEERRDSAIALHAAGVRILFGSGADSAEDLLARVRTLVEEGLPHDAALSALTSQPAEWVGLDRHFGWLREGHGANLCLWTGDPFDEKSQVRWTVVDGFVSEFEVQEKKGGDGPAEGLDLTGTWTVRDPDEPDQPPMTLVLKMKEDGEVSGDAAAKNPMDGSDLASEVRGRIDGEDVALELTFAVGGIEVDVTLEGTLAKDRLTGSKRVKFGGQSMESRFEAERAPQDGGRQ